MHGAGNERMIFHEDALRILHGNGLGQKFTEQERKCGYEDNADEKDKEIGVWDKGKDVREERGKKRSCQESDENAGSRDACL